MKQIEYNIAVHSLIQNPDELKQTLDEFGKDGWILCNQDVSMIKTSPLQVNPQPAMIWTFYREVGNEGTKRLITND